MRGKGNGTNGSMINSQETAEFECETVTWGGEGETGNRFHRTSLPITRRRSDNARSRHPAWPLRHIDGSQSRAKPRDIENHDRGRRKNRVICDIEHRDKNDWWDSWKEDQRASFTIDADQRAVLIPNPAYGYLRGESVRARKDGSVSLERLGGGDLAKLIYVDRLGGNRSGRTFMCDVRDCACRYHMRDTTEIWSERRGVGPISRITG